MQERTRERLASGWRFSLGDVAGAGQKEFDDRAWQEVSVPHDWSIAGPFSEENHPSSGFLPSGIGWYRRLLNLPDLSPGARVFLEFEGVFRDSSLYINGRLAGNHESGYTGAVYDITSYLQWPGSQSLAVRVDATRQEGWWYEGAGLYRHV